MSTLLIYYLCFFVVIFSILIGIIWSKKPRDTYDGVKFRIRAVSPGNFAVEEKFWWGNDWEEVRDYEPNAPFIRAKYGWVRSIAEGEELIRKTKERYKKYAEREKESKKFLKNNPARYYD